MKLTPLQAIVASNVATLIAALIQGWGMVQLLWPFWAQSVIIGLYSMARIRRSADGDARHLLFFLLHYGGFHFGYLVFLIALTTSADAAGMVPVTNTNSGEVMQLYAGVYHPLDWILYAGLAVSFWLSHRASYRAHLEADLASRPSVGRLFAIPYLRILPMHLTLILGVLLGGPGTVVFFMLLKILADLAMHVLEHRLLAVSTSTH
ncbi:DUF6498-containing protein [Wenzhouxiangella marina]|uniref:Uncharacterized protein n=1 Tax=Wenzhouxiangella marina TaxID=1579979 RepID=A0A0K0XU48_9GAMM|nr:DUF6498-containing protein [Wenzhouxiangella marina]AKS41219.1 hypothetical protein WM2015_838 [Wenzhouxiangella marina]MBB6088099.1 hypothetical protein [Wenzhouxiangella marina]